MPRWVIDFAAWPMSGVGFPTGAVRGENPSGLALSRYPPLAPAWQAGPRTLSHARRAPSYPEQKRGACSWCLPVDPGCEPEYWASD
jgi:hypothetical protein